MPDFNTSFVQNPVCGTGAHGWRVAQDAVHASVYCDPQVFEAERTRVFRRSWLFAAHESQLADPGSYLAQDLAGLPVVLVRDRDGTVRCLFNRCPHKGARLVENGRGQLRQFRCPYHAWTFGLDGERLSIPLKDGYDGTGLGSCDWAGRLAVAAKVEDYRGFLFVHFDQAAPDLASHLGSVRHVLDDIVDRSPGDRVAIAGRPYRLRIRANWKLYIENLQDTVHPHAVHQSSYDAADGIAQAHFPAGSVPFRVQLLRNNGAAFPFFELLEQVADPLGHTAMGGIVASDDADPMMRAMRLALTEAKGAEEARRIMAVSRHNTIVYPNLAVQSTFGQLRVIHPVAVDETIVEVYHLRFEGLSEDFYRLRSLAYANTVNAPTTMISADDVETFRRVQDGLRAAAPQWLSLHRDAGRDAVLDGRRTAIGTSELPQRAQMARWRELMETGLD